jgi:hypothetical protein
MPRVKMPVVVLICAAIAALAGLAPTIALELPSFFLTPHFALVPPDRAITARPLDEAREEQPVALLSLALLRAPPFVSALL